MAIFFAASSHAQQKITITLAVNDAQQATVFQNEPVLFDVSVSNKRAEINERWNRTGERRLDEMKEKVKKGEMKEEEYESEKNWIEKSKRKVDVVTLGSESSSWTESLSWKFTQSSGQMATLPVKLMKRPSAKGNAVLDADGYYIASFGIDPETLRSVAPGTYTIHVSASGMSSDAVTLKINPGMMSDAVAGAEAMLLRLGIFYWHAEDAARTIQYADKILAKNPVSLDGLSLKGDGLVLQRSYLPALESYNKAVKEYYKQTGAGSEPPGYLLNMIAFLKKELGEPMRDQ